MNETVTRRKRPDCHSPEALIFNGAKQRCRNPNCPSYKYYGGRGIEVRFTNFKEFFGHIGPRPSPKHSLDRIDNDGHYEPGNVRWATIEQQASSRRNGKSKISCKRGHPLSGENVYLEKTRTGTARHCKSCRTERTRRYRR